MKTRQLLKTVAMILAITFAFSIACYTSSDVAEAQVIKWRMQDLATPGQVHYEARTELFCKKVEEMSNGRLIITNHPSGTLIKSADCFDAASEGSIDITYTVGSYWAGIVGPVAMLGWVIPFTWDTIEEQEAWLYEKGHYIERMRERYAKDGVYLLAPTLSTGVPIMSTKPINGIADLKGLKIRAVGLAAKLLQRAGASVVYIGSEDLYTALSTGVIDAVTWGAPSQNNAMGLQEVCKYYIQPSLATITAGEIIVSMKSWNKLSDDLKVIVSTAYEASRLETSKRMYLADKKYLEEWKKKNGTIVCTFPPEDVAKLREMTLAILDEEVAKDKALGAPIVKDLKQWLRELGHLK